MIRKILSLGKYTAVVSLPRELLHKLGWRRGQKVEVTQKGRKLQIKDAYNK